MKPQRISDSECATLKQKYSKSYDAVAQTMMKIIG